MTEAEIGAARDAVGTFVAQNPEPWTDDEGPEFERLLTAFNDAVRNTYPDDMEQFTIQHMKAKAEWWGRKTVVRSDSPEFVKAARAVGSDAELIGDPSQVGAEILMAQGFGAAIFGDQDATDEVYARIGAEKVALEMMGAHGRVWQLHCHHCGDKSYLYIDDNASPFRLAWEKLHHGGMMLCQLPDDVVLKDPNGEPNPCDDDTIRLP